MRVIKHLPVDWTSNHDRIILYADIMGFKELLKHSDHGTLVQKLHEFVDSIRRRISPYQTAGHLRMTLFSDLVVMAVDRVSTKNFLLIVKAAAELLQECHIHKFPINGCITCGPLVFDEYITPDKTVSKNNPYMPLFAGQSVVDAYLLNEDLFCYGLILHPKAEAIFLQAKDAVIGTKECSPPFYQLNVPLKRGGRAPLYYLNWTQVKLANNDVKLANVIDWTESIAQNLIPRTRAYAINTLELINNFKSQESIENV